MNSKVVSFPYSGRPSLTGLRHLRVLRRFSGTLCRLHGPYTHTSLNLRQGCLPRLEVHIDPSVFVAITKVFALVALFPFWCMSDLPQLYSYTMWTRMQGGHAKRLM